MQKYSKRFLRIKRSNFLYKCFYKTILIKTVYLYKNHMHINIDIHKWIMTENSEIKSSIYGDLLDDMGDIADHCRKGRCWDNWFFQCK